MPAPRTSGRAQISGVRKENFLRNVLREVPDLDDATAERIAAHLSAHIATIKGERTLVERLGQPAFDPNAFSALKIYRTQGEQQLRQRLNELGDSRHLQALAKAQQISLPQRLRARDADPLALRDAIVRGVKKRHEDWQAAS